MATAAEALVGRWGLDEALGCWLWQRGKTTAGYGETWIDGRVQYAHRAMYELLLGPIPEGMQVHHRCEVRACINPFHMDLLAVEDHAGAAGHGKLTREDAAEVRRRAQAGESYKVIAAEYGICRPLVSMIRTGKRWAEA
jgi:hypothetical protein